jgi:EamA domain-containing membrane protein RarD
MDYREWAIDLVSLGLPPLSCGWAWWLWTRKPQSTSVPRWRKVATTSGLVLATLSIAFGGFAYIYWRWLSGYSPSPPEPVFVSTSCGLVSAVLALPFSVFAKSWTRTALVLCCVALFGFYFLMFLSP